MSYNNLFDRALRSAMAKGPIKPQDTRSKLIRAAIDLFYEKGIHWVSFQQIGSKVGVSQAALYKHFSDKDDLLRACAVVSAQSATDVVDASVDSAHGHIEQVRSFIRGNFEWMRRFPKEAVIVLSLYYFAANSKPSHDLLMSLHEESIAKLSEQLKAGGQDGIWASTQLKKSARVLHSLMVGEMIKALHAPDEMSVEHRTNLVWTGFRKNLL